MKPIHQFNLKDIVSINVVIMIAFMVVSSYVCDNGLTGGECTKHYDNRFFIIIILVNLSFSVFSIYKNGWRKLGMLFLNLMILIMLFTVFATLHSVFTVGLF
jgi:uncharacterized membrane-anchored protein YitT (DUF2179 family)